MVDILFLCDFEEGHVIPTFKIAANLRASGLKVAYMGIPDARKFIESNGFEAYPILEEFYPPGYVKQMRELKKIHSPVNNNKYYLSIVNGSLDEVIYKTRPKIILSSMFIALESLLIHYKYKIPQIIYHTALPYNPSRTLAELTIENCYQNFIDLSGETPTAVLSFISKYNTGIKNLMEMTDPLKNMHQWMLCPPQLCDQAQVIGARDQYIGPCIRQSTPEEADATLKMAAQAGDKKIIFASMGTQMLAYQEKSIQFFFLMLQCMKHEAMTGYHLILSVGTQANLDALGSLPSNVSCFTWVSQIEILKKASLAITHGGLGSIKECLFYGVPMIVIPMGRDQTDNARRVVKQNLGYTLEITTITPEVLASQIEDITNNPGLSQSVQAMKNIFHSAETQQKEISLVSELLADK